MINERKYYVYYEDLTKLIGTLFVSFINGKEIHSFEFSEDFLTSNDINKFFDPDLLLTLGRQYPAQNRETFCFLEDSLPDRWGRKLLLRDALKRGVNKLTVIDSLIGISDIYRIGAIRIADENGVFLSTRNTNIPPMMHLKKLENAAVEVDDELSDADLHLLFSPGSSLGGARPKCNVFDTNGDVYIAKFPNKNDDYDVGAMEMVVHDLAKLCEINVPEAKLMKLSHYGSTYLSKRFDRHIDKRIHYASALCLLGARKGEDNSSYLDIANFIQGYCHNVKSQLLELYKRMVFNIIINNTDDHLRNHGFIYNKDGWELAPAFDITIGVYDTNHVLRFDETRTSISLKDIKSLAKLFRLSELDGQKIVDKTVEVVSKNFDRLSKKYQLTREEATLLKSHLLLI